MIRTVCFVACTSAPEALEGDQSVCLLLTLQPLGQMTGARCSREASGFLAKPQRWVVQEVYSRDTLSLLDKLYDTDIGANLKISPACDELLSSVCSSFDTV